MPQRIKIESDGTAFGTRITDPDVPNEVLGLTRVEITIDAEDVNRARLFCEALPAAVIARVDEIKITDPTGASYLDEAQALSELVAAFRSSAQETLEGLRRRGVWLFRPSA